MHVKGDSYAVIVPSFQSNTQAASFVDAPSHKHAAQAGALRGGTPLHYTPFHEWTTGRDS